MVILKYKKSGKVLKLWHVNANSVDVVRLNILGWGLLDPIGTSRVRRYSFFFGIKMPTVPIFYDLSCILMQIYEVLGLSNS